jgi:hypothetical protein
VVAIFVLAIISIAINRFPIAEFVVECGQILFMASLLEIQFPLNLQQFMAGFKPLHLFWLPQFSVPDDVLLNAPGKYVTEFTDNLFARNVGHVYFLGLIFAGVVLVAWALIRFGTAFLANYPKVLAGAEAVLVRLRINGLFELSWFLLYSLGFLSFAQYRDPSAATGYLTFNIIFCAVNTAMAGAFVVWVLHFNYSLLKYETDLDSLARLFPFLLKDVHTNPIGLMNCAFNYIRKFIICVLIGAFSDLPTYFFSITILFTLLTLLPMIRYLPYNNEVQDIFRICQELGLVVLLVLLLFMSLTRQGLTRDQLTSFGWGIVVWAILLLLASLAWGTYLFVLELITLVTEFMARRSEENVVHPDPLPEDQTKKEEDVQPPQDGPVEPISPEDSEDPENQEEGEVSPDEQKVFPKLHNRNDFIHYQPSDMEESDDGDEPPLVLIKCLKNTEAAKQENPDEYSIDQY